MTKEVKKQTAKNKNVNKETKPSEKKINVIKRFLNNPLPMLIVLTVVIVVLLLYIGTIRHQSKIYVGEINEEKVNVSNIHYFANNQMNYFYASNALYLDDDAKIFSYQIGYYVVSPDGTYHELATRSGKFEKSTSLRDVVLENSGWTISELATNDYFFDANVLRNLDNLHFLVLASTDKEKPNDPDIKVDYKVKLTTLAE